MVKIVDRVCCWKGWANGQGSWESRCRLRIYQLPNDNKIVIYSSDIREEDTGTSITNCSEDLSTFVSRDFGLIPSQTMFVEHYYNLYERQYPETFDSITYQVEDPTASSRFISRTFSNCFWLFSRPKWSPIDKGILEKLIGEKL